MGRKLSDSRRQALMANIAARLPAGFSTGDKLKPAQVAAAGEAIGLLFRRGSSVGGVGQAPKAFLEAARDLARAQADDSAALESGSPAPAVSRWIETFINPASPSALEGADRLWTKGLSRERDLDRRRRNMSDGVGPVKLALSTTYGRMLADLHRQTGKSTREIVENLVETAHRKNKTTQARRSRPVTDLVDLFGESVKTKK